MVGGISYMSETIEDLLKVSNKSIHYEDLHMFFNEKLKELYGMEKTMNLLDHDEIRNSAMIDFIYEIMPSLREEIKFKESKNQIEAIV